MAKVEDIYRSIALEYINGGFQNIQAIYKKYHPKVSKASLNVLPYNLLENVRFKRIKDELVDKIMKDKENKATECLNKLVWLVFNAHKDSDKIAATHIYLKFTVGEKFEGNISISMKPEEEAELNMLRRGNLFSPSEN